MIAGIMDSCPTCNVQANRLGFRLRYAHDEDIGNERTARTAKVITAEAARQQLHKRHGMTAVARAACALGGNSD